MAWHALNAISREWEPVDTAGRPLGADPPDPGPVVSMLAARPPGAWLCGMCLVPNPPDERVCGHCNVPRL